MQAFDFDGTIYDGDSSKDFCLFCLTRKGSCLKALPSMIGGTLAFLMRKTTLKAFKESFFSFLGNIDNIDDVLDAFWRKNARKLKPPIVERVQTGDLLISASPEFLLTIPCAELGMKLIATRMDAKTGKIAGENCKGEQKVIRCFEAGYTEPFDAFYTDSSVDKPMMGLAKKNFLVKKDTIVEID